MYFDYITQPPLLLLISLPPPTEFPNEFPPPMFFRDECSLLHLIRVDGSPVATCWAVWLCAPTPATKVSPLREAWGFCFPYLRWNISGPPTLCVHGSSQHIISGRRISTVVHTSHQPLCAHEPLLCPDPWALEGLDSSSPDRVSINYPKINYWSRQALNLSSSCLSLLTTWAYLLVPPYLAKIKSFRRIIV